MESPSEMSAPTSDPDNWCPGRRSLRDCRSCVPRAGPAPPSSTSNVSRNPTQVAPIFVRIRACGAHVRTKVLDEATPHRSSRCTLHACRVAQLTLPSPLLEAPGRVGGRIFRSMDTPERPPGTQELITSPIALPDRKMTSPADCASESTPMQNTVRQCGSGAPYLTRKGHL